MRATPRQNQFWPWRVLAFIVLLTALWGYVVPYQTGVRLDQSLNGWICDHPGWTLVRGERSLYQRQYELHWQPDWATEPVVLAVRVFPRPFGWVSPAGRQWGWATFSVRMDPNSPVQISRWPDRAFELTGQVEGLGLVRFHWAAGEADHNQLLYDRPDQTWRGTLNLPGWQIITPTHHFLFGRTLIDFHLRHREQGSHAFWRGLDGELGIDIRRIGWRKTPHSQSASTQRSVRQSTLIGLSPSGLVDHFQLRLRLMPDFSGGQRDVIGSGALDALQVDGRHLGGGQLAFAIYAADPDFAKSVAALWLQVLFNTEKTSTRLALTPVLSSLYSAEIRLDALRWQTPAGSIELSAKAFGPRFTGSDPLTSPHDHQQGQGQWQARAQLQFSGAIMQAPLMIPLVDWLDSWLPVPLSRFAAPQGTPVRLVLAYSPKGWVLDQSEVEAPAANHTKTP